MSDKSLLERLLPYFRENFCDESMNPEFTLRSFGKYVRKGEMVVAEDYLHSWATHSADTAVQQVADMCGQLLNDADIFNAMDPVAAFKLAMDNPLRSLRELESSLRELSTEEKAEFPLKDSIVIPLQQAQEGEYFLPVAQSEAEKAMTQEESGDYPNAIIMGIREIPVSGGSRVKKLDVEYRGEWQPQGASAPQPLSEEDVRIVLERDIHRHLEGTKKAGILPFSEFTPLIRREGLKESVVDNEQSRLLRVIENEAGKLVEKADGKEYELHKQNPLYKIINTKRATVEAALRVSAALEGNDGQELPQVTLKMTEVFFGQKGFGMAENSPASKLAALTKDASTVEELQSSEKASQVKVVMQAINRIAKGANLPPH